MATLVPKRLLGLWQESKTPKSGETMSDHHPAFPSLPSLEYCVESIEAAYAQLGHQRGWRFLAGPRRTFTASTRFAFITLNPGGTCEDPAHPRTSSENGSAYWIESWKECSAGTEPLQFQVQELFARIACIVGASEPTRDFVETRVLAAYFVPFRSPNFDKLHRPRESIAFARQLWSDILAGWTPRTILTIDQRTFKNLCRIISDRPAVLITDRRRFPTGWGDYTAEACCFQMPDREEIVRLARLPHLSRFRLMSNDACRQPVQEFLSYVFEPGSRGASGRSGIDGAELYPEWEAYIEDQQARGAFRLLVDLAALSPRLALSFKGVRKRTCCLHDRSGRQPYSFIVNKSWLLFYFRLPEVRSGRDRLKRDFDSFNVNSKGEWTVRLRTEDDVRLLLTHVDWLGGDHSGSR